MIQGTMSGAGKSLIAAGLCRIFAQDGYKVAPFKSQNMALNSCITKEGLEMGRAQVVQAECARIEPMVCMNPVLLKPTSNVGSQVIVNGKVLGNMKTAEYFKYKTQLIPEIKKAFDRLSGMVDIIVIEGAGSPVELNLKDNDIVNMGLARMTDAPVVLVGDIDRGGVFAQLYGTVSLLEEDERARVKGLIVNRFRGDISLFDDGIKILEDKCKTKVLGVVPYMDLHIDDEDSLSERFDVKDIKSIDIAVIKLPHISNYTDFDVFEQLRDISVRYVKRPEELGDPDMLVIPGSKNTIDDLRFIKKTGFDERIGCLAKKGTLIFGICGGYQMLGRNISDPHNTESGSSETGLGLLCVDTVMEEQKTRTVFEGNITAEEGALKSLSGTEIAGYEIHTGKTVPYDEISEFTSGGTGCYRDNIYGTYIHGIFDKKDVFTGIIKYIAGKKNISVDMDAAVDQNEYKDRQYDLLADGLRKSLDMDLIYEILG